MRSSAPYGLPGPVHVRQNTPASIAGRSLWRPEAFPGVDCER